MSWELYEGDCLDIMRTFADESVDAVITDPPYSSGGLTRGDRISSVHSKYVNSGSSNKSLPGFHGDTRDQRSFGFWATLWLSEALRLTKPGGVCMVFTDWRQLPVTTDALQAGGWMWRGIVPWHKPGSRPMKGRFANACEYVVWGTKGPRPLDAIGGRTLPGFFQASSPRNRKHITEKPIAVMRELVNIVPEGGVVLDPFAGSGTTLEAAVQMGRQAIGIEIDPVFCEIIRERMRGYSGQSPVNELGGVGDGHAVRRRARRGA